MGAAAAVGIALIGTVASVENSNQQRRLAGQARDRQQHDVEVANRRMQEEKDLEENQAFSKIQRQRQRAIAANTAAPAQASSLISAGQGSLGNSAAPSSGGGKTTLGS